MKIVMLAAADSIHSWRWVEYFARRGHEMHWISLNRFTAPGPPNVQTYEAGEYFSTNYVGAKLDNARLFSNPKGILALFQAVMQIRRILNNVAPYLFHIHSVGTYGLVGALTGFHPLVATAWGSDVLLAAKSPLKRPIIKFVLRRADTITCDAYHMRDAMVNLGVADSKIKIVYFGTDTIKFRPNLDGKEIRKKLELGDGPVILSTRSLLPIYDVASLVRAIPRVLKDVRDVRCVIVGDGSERERLIALTEELGIASVVCFAGPVSGDEIPQYLAAADIHVSTSLSDAGLAASTAEAMACGLPVIVTDSGENRIWVKDGAGGCVLPAGDAEALADKIIYLARKPDERKRFGAYNRRIIEERNNYYIEMEKMEGVYLCTVNAFEAIRR